MPFVKSVSNSQDQIIQSIINLHAPNGIDLDPTYSKGNFYKNKIEAPALKFDISPIGDDVKRASATNLPIESNTIGCIMFDPPFLATKGPSLAVDNESNAILKRFGVFETEQKLHCFYVDALRELYRVCKPGGVLIFKCQDKVSSGKQYFSHCFIHENAVETGWYPRDLFVLTAKSRMMPKWQTVNQQHARKFHSYFWVFQKKNSVIKYTGSE